MNVLSDLVANSCPHAFDITKLLAGSLFFDKHNASHQGPLRKAWLARKITVEIKYGVCKSYLDPKNITTVVIGSKYQNS